MKKIVLLIAVLIASITTAKAQNDTTFYVTNDFPQKINICVNRYDHATVYAMEGSSSPFWSIGGVTHTENPIELDSHAASYYAVTFYCGSYVIGFDVEFIEPNVPSETTTPFWKHQGYPITLESIGADSLEMYNFLWNTGEATPIIEVTAPGTYTCSISDPCATATRTFIVRDNVEIDLATCDLESNLNLVTWPTTVAQAQYIDHVIVKRDGLQVGTAPYSDGQFTDNIGSGSASRTYTLTAIATDGTECPIVSYPKETIHMAYLTGINNTIEVNWNIPAGYDLLGYNICEWHENDGSLSVIDFVGASVTSYTCSESQFDEGYIVVQGVEAGKDGETRLLSNRSLDLVGLGENEAMAFKVYPNPAKDRFIVEGTGKMTVTNTLGQTVLTKEIDGKAIIELPQGMYFVKLDAATRKVVVE